MITERVDSYASHFQIFAARIISADERLHLIAHRFLNRTLARNCGTTCGLSTTPRRQDFATTLRPIAA
jgi:hypothetical protein